MGLLQMLFGEPSTSSAPIGGRPARKSAALRGQIEALEPRQLLSGDGLTPEVLLGSVYFEEATGDDSQPDVIQVTFVGGAEGTTLDRLVISGDKRLDGLTDGDIFFDTTAGGRGAFDAVGLSIVETEGLRVTSVEVADGATDIVFTFDSFEAGETLKFSIDADELQFADPAGDSVNSLVEGAEFERSILTGEFSAVGYVNLTLSAKYWDAFDTNFETAQDATQLAMQLPQDRFSAERDFADRTAGAVDHAPQIELATLSGWVYHDRSDDGERNEASEEGISGVTLELLDAQGNGTGITTTTSNEAGTVGFYEFRNLTAGTYGVREVQPSGWLDGKDTPGSHGGAAADEAGGRVDIITGAVLGFGDDGVEYNFGELLVGSIAGRVHASSTGDCNFDDPEVLLAGVTIDLLDARGQVVATTQTDTDGRYRFDGLAPGEYAVREHQPTDYYDGAEQVGTSGGVASDLGQANDPAFSLISEIQLGSGVDATNYSFCEHIGPSISGWVYHDRSNEGTFNRGTEQGIGGVVMELLDASGTPTGITTATSSSAGTVGYYEFTDLAPGQYGVREFQPQGWIDGIDTAGTHGGVAAVETSGPVDRITGALLNFGDVGREYNFGELLAASIAGRVHASIDGDCDFDAPEILLVGVQIDLLDEFGSIVLSTVTNADGEYSFDSLAPGIYQVFEHQPAGYFDGDERVGTAGGEQTSNDTIGRIALTSGFDAVQYDFCEHLGVSLSGYVYHDRSNEGSFDRATEEGIPQVTLKLLDGEGVDTGRRAVTDSQGYYEFANLAPGKYAVMEIHPEGWLDGIDTPGNLGGVADPSPPGDMLGEIMIGFGETGVEYNFGELKPGSIRGRVHVDTDGDCEPNESEAPIAGVEMQLLNEVGEVIATTLTDTNGEYAFEGLRPGNYSVRQVQPGGYFDGGYHINSGNGSPFGANTIGDIQLGSNANLIHYDFCEIPPAKLSGYVFIDGAPILAVSGLPSDLSTLRDGQRTPDDTPLPGVTLELRQGFSGDPIFGTEALPGYYPDGPIRTVTDASGYYEFDGLPGGSYAVVEVQPSGVIDSLDTQGTLGGLVVNAVGASRDPVLIKTGGLEPGQQAAIEQMRTRFGNDIIFRVPLQAGQHSEENNFSEVTQTTIFIPPTKQPPELTPLFAPPQFVRPQAIFPLVAPETPTPPIYGGSSKVVGYTWHLSLVNAGHPRSTPVETDEVIQFTSSTTDATAWQPADINQAEWRLEGVQADSEHAGDAVTLVVFGHSSATPVVGDWDGDGDDEVGVFINGKWYFDINGNGRWDKGDLMAELGSGSDLPTTGDWDGDGKTDIAIFGPVWAGDPWAIENEPGLPDAENSPGPIAGKPKNVPPKTEEATLGARTLQLTERGEPRKDLIDHVFHYGVPGDKPVTGDWNGDGIATIGVFRSGVWQLDVDGDGRFTEADIRAEFGIEAGESGVPVIGDWDGDGIDDLGVFAAGQWTIDSNGDRVSDARDKVFELGTAGDKPVAGDWDGDGTDQPGVYSPRTAALPGDQAA